MKRVFALSLFGVALVPTLGTGLCLLFDEIKPAEIVYKSSRLKAMSMNEDDVKPLENQDIEVLVQLKTEEFNPPHFYEEDPIKYREKLLEYGREFYKEQNKIAMKDINLSSVDNVYVTKYGPYFSFTMKEEDLVSTYTRNRTNFLDELANMPTIEEIIVSSSADYVPNALPDDFVDTFEERQRDLEFTYIDAYGIWGDGVKVGMLETGVPDKNHTNITGKDITIRDQWLIFEDVTEHATAIASIIMSFAPRCSLYCHELRGADAHEELDWLLDKGCTVINMSYGDTIPDGNYSAKSAYCDKIANNYKTTFVGAVGNDNGYVCNPALGYNVIGVGNINNNSGYQTNTGPIKPNILAEGNDLMVPNVGPYCGTSVSCAITTSLVARLMGEYPDLTLHPEQVMTILYASAESIYDAANRNELVERYGTGHINARLAYRKIPTIRTGTNSSTENFSDYVSVNLVGGDHFKAVGTWLAKATGSASGTTFTDYDLYLYDPYGTRASYSTSTIDNVEYIEHIAQYDGTYTLVFLQRNTLVQVDNYAFAYSINT